MKLRILLLMLLVPICAISAPAAAEDGAQLFALQYGKSMFKSKAIFADGDDTRLPVSWMFWVVKEPNGVYLIDTGMQDPSLIKNWNLKNYVPPLKLLETMKISPDSVTGIVLTHLHVDHADCILSFPRTRVFLQAKEYAAITSAFSGDKAGKLNSGGYRRNHFEHLLRLQQAGLLTLLDGSASVSPNIRVELAPYHTAGCQTVIVNTGPKEVWLVPDNVYLYTNIERMRPVGTCRDRAGNLAFIRKVSALDAARTLVVPGHDPRIFEGHENVVQLPGN